MGLLLVLLAAVYSDFTNSPSGITVHLAGDSTMAIQRESQRPLTGWGEPLPSMLCDNVNLLNHAKNGRSSKSFIDEGLWDDLLSQVRPNDVVLIQFGHNDQKSDNPALYASPWLNYQQNLQQFVTHITAQRAVPVLLTSITRRSFNTHSELEQTLGEYPAVARLVAADTETKLIDLHAMTRDLVTQTGVNESKKFYLHLQAGLHPNYPQGIADNTHLSGTGANDIAKLVAIKLKGFFPALICL